MYVGNNERKRTRSLSRDLVVSRDGCKMAAPHLCEGPKVGPSIILSSGRSQRRLGQRPPCEHRGLDVDEKEALVRRSYRSTLDQFDLRAP